MKNVTTTAFCICIFLAAAAIAEDKKDNSLLTAVKNNLLLKKAILPRLIDVPVGRTYLNESTKLADIVNRCNIDGLNGPSFGNSRSTNAHESTHRLQAGLRNQQGGRVNAFYLMDGKAAIVKEPGIRKAWVASFVPQSLHHFRFATYVTGQTAWDSEPLYLVDEWSAYINGCLVALEDKQTGRFVDQSDEACGVIELGIYCVAMAMAVEKHDPEYFKSETQFKNFMRFQWERAKEVFDQGAPVFPFDSQDRLLKNLRTSPDAEAMRTFIKAHLGGAWLTP